MTFIVVRAWAAPADNASYDDPIAHFMESALSGNPQLFIKHKDIQNYFNQFIPIWKDTLQKLASQDPQKSLEVIFKNDQEVATKGAASLKKLKPPSDYKDFQEALTKGMEALGDWCGGMNDRIHYATSDYQKQAYMKRIEAFKTDWFPEFFGPALDELKDGWNTFAAYYWMDNLTPQQQKSVQQNRAVDRYLHDFYKIAFNHVKALSTANRKLREAQDNSDNPTDYITGLQKEEDDIQKTVSRLQKVAAPEGFRDFHVLQIQWLQAVAQETQKAIDYEIASQNRAADDKLQTLIYERNVLTQQAAELRDSLDKAYASALNGLQAKR